MLCRERGGCGHAGERQAPPPRWGGVGGHALCRVQGSTDQTRQQLQSQHSRTAGTTLAHCKLKAMFALPSCAACRACHASQQHKLDALKQRTMLLGVSFRQSFACSTLYAHASGVEQLCSARHSCCAARSAASSLASLMRECLLQGAAGSRTLRCQSILLPAPVCLSFSATLLAVPLSMHAQKAFSSAVNCIFNRLSTVCFHHVPETGVHTAVVQRMPRRARHDKTHSPQSPWL